MAASQRLKLSCWGGALLLLALGCAPAIDAPPSPRQADSSTDQSVAASEVVARSDESLEKETWEAHSIQDQRVGYGHTTVTPVAVAGHGDCVQTRQESLLTMVREGQPIEQRIELSTVETLSGELLTFESNVQSGGGGDIQATGAVADGKLTIEAVTAGKSATQVIPWQQSWGGFFAIEQSLAAKPMQPGERRSITSLLPVFHVAGETGLTADDFESVDLGDGKTSRLLKIRSVLSLGGQTLESSLWCDESGEILKSYMPGVEQVALRTTKEIALAKSDAPPLDLIAASIVPLKRGLPSSTNSKRVTYRATLKQGEIEGLFPDCLSQRVTLVDSGAAKLDISAVRPTSPAEPGEPTQPTDDDRQPNNLVQSDDRQVAELAHSVAPAETDPATLAVALEKLVHGAVREKNFSQAFATAAEVAANLEGDCTEHAVLLAGVCRARGLPARVACGLVYYPPRNGFAYHMWNEVWIGDRWLPLDATLGQGGIGADHIKLADSNLKGASAYSAMLPVLQVFGRLELEVVEVE